MQWIETRNKHSCSCPLVERDTNRKTGAAFVFVSPTSQRACRCVLAPSRRLPRHCTDQLSRSGPMPRSRVSDTNKPLRLPRCNDRPRSTVRKPKTMTFLPPRQTVSSAASTTLPTSGAQIAAAAVVKTMKAAATKIPNIDMTLAKNKIKSAPDMPPKIPVHKHT